MNLNCIVVMYLFALAFCAKTKNRTHSSANEKHRGITKKEGRRNKEECSSKEGCSSKEECSKKEEKEECPKKKEYDQAYIDSIDCFPFLDEEIIVAETSPPQPQTNQNSICVLCMTCIAVAEKLTDELDSTGKSQCYQYPPLQEICSNGFQRYEFQEHKGNQFIGLLESSARLISTGDNEPWSQKLEDLCYLLTSFYGEKNIYDDWKNHESLITSLCK